MGARSRPERCSAPTDYAEKMDLAAALHLELAALLPLVGGVVGGALLLCLMVTALTACSVPGVLIPMSLTASLLLGPLPAILVVATGGLGGSLLLFALTRRFGAARVRQRFGKRLDAFEQRFGRLGPLAVAALRVAGAPGPLVTAGAAVTGMRVPLFALATVAGLLPSVSLAALGPHVFLG